MIGHDEQARGQPGLALTWRVLLAFVGGLVLGLLGSLLLGSFDWSGKLFVLFGPLLLGMIGRLMVGTRAKDPEPGGLAMGWMSWFGVWLAVLGWESFQPQTISGCFHADPPCYPTTVPFWGEDAWFFLLGFFLYLIVGLVIVVVGVSITSIVLHVVRRRASWPAGG